MTAYFQRLSNQCERVLEDLCAPQAQRLQDRIESPMTIGAKCSWCFDDDVKFWRDEKIKMPHPKDWPYGGLIIPFPDTELRGPTIDAEHAMVIVIRYPVEKCYVECDWVTLGYLLNSPNLHRFYVMAVMKLQ